MYMHDHYLIVSMNKSSRASVKGAEICLKWIRFTVVVMFSLLIVYDAGRKVQYVSSEKSIASMLVQNYHALSKQKKDLILDIVGDVHCKLYCLHPYYHYINAFFWLRNTLEDLDLIMASL